VGDLPEVRSQFYKLAPRNELYVPLLGSRCGSAVKW
jgi:hypothetical protein